MGGRILPISPSLGLFQWLHLRCIFNNDYLLKVKFDIFTGVTVHRGSCSSNMGQTPVLDQFLSSLQEIVQSRDGSKLQDFLQLEPPLSDIYQRMIVELRQNYGPGPKTDADILQRCERLVPRTKGGSSWIAFPAFVKLYLIFLRDMNTDNLLETYNQLKALLK
jgi:hypothetical protein